MSTRSRYWWLQDPIIRPDMETHTDVRTLGLGWPTEIVICGSIDPRNASGSEVCCVFDNDWTMSSMHWSCPGMAYGNFDTKDARDKFDSVDRAFLSYVASDDHWNRSSIKLLHVKKHRAHSVFVVPSSPKLLHDVYIWNKFCLVLLLPKTASFIKMCLIPFFCAFARPYP